MYKLCLFLALGALGLPAGLCAVISVSKPMFLYEADPYVTYSMSVGSPSDYVRGLNREIRTGDHHGASLAFGYRYDSWSFELEAAFRASQVDGHLFFDSDPFINSRPVMITEDAEGTVEDTSLMFNGIYEFPTWKSWRPYVGGGVGLSRVALRDFRRPDSVFNPGERTSDSDVALAFQLMVGVSFELAPETDLLVGYRYFGTGDIDWTVHDYWQRDNPEDLSLSGTNVHLFEFGLRLNF